MSLRDGPVGVKYAFRRASQLELKIRKNRGKKARVAAASWAEHKYSQKNRPFHILSSSRSEKARLAVKYVWRDARAFSRVALSVSRMKS
jgi:hypothetical protein